MEDQNNKQSTPKPINDIQPSQAPTSDVTQVPAPDSIQQTGAEFTEAPADDSADQVVLPTSQPEQVNPLIATTSPSSVEHKAPVGVIIVAILIAVALAATAVLTYMKNDKEEASSKTTPTTSQQTEQQQVTIEDVDTTSTELDNSLNEADEATDFNTNSLSDSSLNL